MYTFTTGFAFPSVCVSAIPPTAINALLKKSATRTSETFGGNPPTYTRLACLLGPTKLWTGLVLHHKDVFVSHVISKLNRTDRRFFSKVNGESWDVLEYAGVNVSGLSASVYECSSISTLEWAWNNMPWGKKDRAGRVLDQAWFCREVAATNKLEFLKWAREVKHCEWDEDTITVALIKGNLEMLKYCFSNGCPCDEEKSCERAAKGGHLDCVRFLFDKVEPSRETERTAALQAACGGHTDILKYFVEERRISSYEEKCNCVVNAAMYGKLDCLKYLLGEEAKAPLNFWQYIAYARYYEHPDCENYLLEKGCPEPTDEQYAARIGERDVWDLIVKCDDICFKHIIPRLNSNDVKFLYGVNTETRALVKRSTRKGELEKGFKVYEMSSISTLEVAWENKSLWPSWWDEIWFCRQVARTNKLELLKWAREEKKCEWSAGTINAAAYRGNLEMVKYCVANECPIDEWACAQAAQKGHLEVLKYLREEVKAPWGSRTASYAAHNGHLHILEYLVERKFDKYEEDACEFAAKFGHLNCLKYLRETAKAPWDDWSVYFAHKNNHPECLQYLLDNNCPLPYGWRYEDETLHTS
ncbi:unnamed protein product [Bathycoccus prasinos]